MSGERASERLRARSPITVEVKAKDDGPSYQLDLWDVPLPEIIALVEAAEEAKAYLDWAVDVEIPKHESALTAELREQTGRDDINAKFDSPLPALRDALAQNLDALASKLSGEGQG